MVKSLTLNIVLVGIIFLMAAGTMFSTPVWGIPTYTNYTTTSIFNTVYQLGHSRFYKVPNGGDNPDISKKNTSSLNIEDVKLSVDTNPLGNIKSFHNLYFNLELQTIMRKELTELDSSLRYIFINIGAKYYMPLTILLPLWMPRFVFTIGADLGFPVNPSSTSYMINHKFIYKLGVQIYPAQLRDYNIGVFVNFGGEYINSNLASSSEKTMDYYQSFVTIGLIYKKRYILSK